MLVDGSLDSFSYGAVEESFESISVETRKCLMRDQYLAWKMNKLMSFLQ